MNHFAPQSHNLAAIIRGYKIAITTYARKNNISFYWQPRYHEHIIRSQPEFDKIDQYIKNNVSNWYNDKFYK